MKVKFVIAKKLRKNNTDAENELWYHLRSKRFSNFKFRRQHLIGNYIVDLVCLSNKLVIECDGGQHLENQDDVHRTRWLESEGYTVLRFWNHHILKDTKTVLESIWEHCHPPPNPLPAREGGINAHPLTAPPAPQLYSINATTRPPAPSPSARGGLPQGRGGSIETHFDGETIRIPETLIEKYDRPGPRYTSYPTAPTWTAEVGEGDFWQALRRGKAKGTALSLYVHLPFCDELCTFCGCSTVITKKHAVTTPYLDHLFCEIDRVADRVDQDRSVIQIHWGGGTPTYLSSDEITRLMLKLKSRFRLAPDAEVSVEVDPRVTTPEQLAIMRELGVNRISMGVQDFNPRVQAAVNRIQPEEMTRQMIGACRELGYHSVNTDLIYGLPHQTVDSFRETVAQLIAMAPDRVALFNFAYVPWMKRQQAAMNPATLPSPAEKFQIYCNAIAALTDAGYLFIGMDHFAKPNDELSAALRDRTLARNFQGYTTRTGHADMLAFGITAISDIDGCLAQNKKILARYYRDLDEGRLAIERGKVCTADDRLRRDLISDLFCNSRISKDRLARDHGVTFDDYFAEELKELMEFENDGLVEITAQQIHVTPRGRLFVRNIGMVFDKYLHDKASGEGRFSRTI